MQELLKSIYGNEKKKRALFVIGTLSVYITAASFLVCLFILAFRGDYFTALEIGGAALIGFVAVSIARKLINAPRPYEVYDFYIEKPKDRAGHSFPSRHCYSAFVIATLAFELTPILSAVLLVFALAVAVCRVLLGIHFVRDVVAGAVIGIITGTVALLLLHFL